MPVLSPVPLQSRSRAVWLIHTNRNANAQPNVNCIWYKERTVSVYLWGSFTLRWYNYLYFGVVCFKIHSHQASASALPLALPLGIGLEPIFQRYHQRHSVWTVPLKSLISILRVNAAAWCEWTLRHHKWATNGGVQYGIFKTQNCSLRDSVNKALMDTLCSPSLKLCGLRPKPVWYSPEWWASTWLTTHIYQPHWLYKEMKLILAVRDSHMVRAKHTGLISVSQWIITKSCWRHLR